MKAYRASNSAGFDRHGRLRKVKRFEAWGDNPRAAAAECLRLMQAGRSRTPRISIWEGELEGTSFVTAISFGPGGSRNWTIPATPQGVETVPEA